MSAFLITHLLLVTLVTLIATASFGRALGPICSLLFFTTVYPRTITDFSLESHHGVADIAPELTTYSLAAILALMIVPRQKPDQYLVAVLGIAGGLVIAGLSLSWNNDQLTWAGILQYLLGGIALIVGIRAGNAINWNDTKNLGRLTLCIGFLISVQTVVSGMQVIGIDINPVSANASEWVGSRVNGTSNHPNTLGKQLVFLTACLLPATRVQKRWIRSLALLLVLTAVILIAITGGRANFIGVLLMLVTWVIFLPSARSLAKVTTFVAISIVAAAFADYFIQRFQEDPTGGSRDLLLPVARSLFQTSPALGHGPNNYVAAASNIDLYTNLTRLPVHNSFLLLANEIGTLGAALLLLPILALTLRSFKKMRREGVHHDFSRAVVTLSPAVILIGATGFGLIAREILPLWLVATGLLYGASQASKITSPLSTVVGTGKKRGT